MSPPDRLARGNSWAIGDPAAARLSGTWDIWVDQTRTSQPMMRIRGLDRSGRRVVRKYRSEIPTLSDIVDEACYRIGQVQPLRPQGSGLA